MAATTKKTAPPKAKHTGCKCVEQMNKLLAEKNAQLDCRTLMNFKTGKCRTSPPLLSVVKLDSSKRKPSLPTVLCSFCPCCGKEFPK